MFHDLWLEPSGTGPLPTLRVSASGPLITLEALLVATAAWCQTSKSVDGRRPSLKCSPCVLIVGT